MLSGILIYLSQLYALLHVCMQIKKNELSSVVRIYDLRSLMSVVNLFLQFNIVWAVPVKLSWRGEEPLTFSLSPFTY